MVDSPLERSEPPPDRGADLMLRVRAGDTTAFEELVVQYQQPVLALIHRYVGDRSAAEDLAQDVFVRVFRARATYERKARFDTWLYRIVFNLCVNATQYGRRRRALSLDQGGASGPGGEDEGGPMQIQDERGTTPLDQLERDEVGRRVREAVERLPEQQRAALMMHRYAGMPLLEIAAALDTSEEAVKSLLFRAREKLRTWLAPYLRQEVRDEL